MTNPFPIPREIRESSIIAGDGRATYGPFNFKIWDTRDVTALVSRNGGPFRAEEVTATKVANKPFDDFVAVFYPRLDGDDEAIIKGRRLTERTTDITRGGSIPGVALEREFSIVTTTLQELRRDVDRAEDGLSLSIDKENLTADGRQIQNLGPALNDNDAATLGQIKELIAAIPPDTEEGVGLPIRQQDVTGLLDALAATEKKAQRGQANGFAPLGNDARVPLLNLPQSTGTAPGVTKVVNFLTVEDASSALSAAQGKKLQETKADKGRTLASYTIEDAYTKDETNRQIEEAVAAGGPGGDGSDTPARILEKLLTVDGSSSGLDADLFDGKDSSDFVLREIVGKALGVASLGGDGLVPSSQLPAAFAAAAGAPVVYLTDGVDMANPPLDWSDAMEANLARAQALGRPFIVPAGRFVVSRQFIVSLKVGDAPFSILGYGKRLSSIEWIAGAQSSGIVLQTPQARQAIQIENVAFVQRGQGVGTAVTVDFSGQIVPNNGNPVTNDRVSPRGHMKCCYVGGAGNQFTTGWLNGIRVVAPVAFHVYDCDFVGNISGPGITTYGSDTAVYIGNPDGYGHPVECYVERNRIWHTKKGIIFEGCEGAYTNFNQVIGFNTGIWFKDTLGRPQLCAIGNHCNGNGVCILAENCAQFTIIGNLLYLVTDANMTATGVLVRGANSRGGQILINQFENTDTTYSSFHFNSIIVERGEAIMIDHNVYRRNCPAGISGVWLTSGATRVKVGDGETFLNTVGPPTFEVKDDGFENRCPGYGLRMSKGGSQNCPAGQLTIITYDVLDDVVGNPADNLVDGAFIIPSSGLWSISAGITCSTSSAGGNYFNIQKNALSGAAIVGTYIYNDAQSPMTVSLTTGPIRLQKGDQIRVGFNAGYAKSVTNAKGTFFEARRIS